MMATRTREDVEFDLRLHTAERDLHVLERDVSDAQELTRLRAPLEEEIRCVKRIIALRAKAIRARMLRFDLADRALPRRLRVHKLKVLNDLLEEIAATKGDIDLSSIGLDEEILAVYVKQEHA